MSNKYLSFVIKVLVLLDAALSCLSPENPP